MKKTSRIPKLRRHAQSNRPDRAYVFLDGKNIYLGDWGTPETQAAYQRFVAEWLSRGCRLEGPPSEQVTVSELADAFLDHVEREYTSPNVIGTAQRSVVALVSLYGPLACVEFSALSLKAIQERMVNDGLCISTVNARTAMIRRVFRYGVESNMIPGEVYHRVQAVQNLKRGHTRARPSRVVRPCSIQDVEATLPYLTAPIALCVRLMLLTGARVSEILTLRRGDIDMAGDVWTAVIHQHKTAHHGKARVLCFGPKAQALLRPILLRKRDDDYLIDPHDGVADRAARMREAARRRILESGGDPDAVQIGRRPDQPETPRQTDRRVGDCYNKADFARAIRRGIERLNADRQAKGEKCIPFWHSHQIRHYVATMARQEYGAEATRALLGHSRLATTEIYAEVDKTVAEKIISKIG